MSTVPTVGVGNDARAIIGSWGYSTRIAISRYSSYLGDYPPYAGGLSAVNAIGTQLRYNRNEGFSRPNQRLNLESHSGRIMSAVEVKVWKSTTSL